MSTIKLGGVVGDDVVHYLSRFFKQLHGLHDRPTHGGYFTVACGATGVALCVQGIGEVYVEKAPRYLFNSAVEKPKRLAEHDGHLSSFQSADLEVSDSQRSKYAGAVRAGNRILSFSGLPELLDEAIVLVVGVQLHYFGKEYAERVAGISKNPYYERVLAIAVDADR